MRNGWVIIPWHSVRKRREHPMEGWAKNREKSLGCLHWVLLEILKLG